VVTLVDRLVHRAEIVTIEGDSYRLKEAKERAAQKATPATKLRPRRANSPLRKPRYAAARVAESVGAVGDVHHA